MIGTGTSRQVEAWEDLSKRARVTVRAALGEKSTAIEVCQRAARFADETFDALVGAEDALLALKEQGAAVDGVHVAILAALRSLRASFPTRPRRGIAGRAPRPLGASITNAAPAVLAPAKALVALDAAREAWALHIATLRWLGAAAKPVRDDVFDALERAYAARVELLIADQAHIAAA